PFLAGPPQQLTTDVDTNITCSPDGRSLAYSVMNNPELGKFRLVTYSLENGEAKTLVTGNVSQALQDPGWLPVGRTIPGVIFQQGDPTRGFVAVDALTANQRRSFGSTDGIRFKP